jgi:hypothetical protein
MRTAPGALRELLRGGWEREDRCVEVEGCRECVECELAHWGGSMGVHGVHGVHIQEEGAAATQDGVAKVLERGEREDDGRDAREHQDDASNDYANCAK